MKLTNMAIMKSNMAEDSDEIVKNVGYSAAGLGSEGEKAAEGPEYPYCLKLYLGPEELAKLGMTELPQLGSTIDLMAKAMVVGQRLDDNNKTMEIQITDMALGSGEAAKKSPLEALYGGGKPKES